MPVPHANNVDLHRYDELLRQIGREWACNSNRPTPSREQLSIWNEAIAQAIHTLGVPLLVRRRQNPLGMIGVHIDSGRKFVPTDNSPAHWAFTSAFDKRYSSTEQILEALKDGTTIPIAQVYPASVAGHGYGAALNAQFSVNTRGWKLAHCKGVGLGGNQLIQTRQLTTLIEHCRLFLSPDNLFVVPKAWAGLAEVPAFIEGFSEGVESLQGSQ